MLLVCFMHSLSIFSLIFFIVLAFAKCSTQDESEVTANLQDGKQLARQYCSTCHLTPEPSDLDKYSWKTHVLPRMGQFMGVYLDSVSRESLIEQGVQKELNEAGIYPETPILSLEEWTRIQEYYLTAAPEQMRLPQVERHEETSLPFDLKVPTHQLSPPSSTMVKFTDGGLFLGDVFTKKLFCFDSNLRLKEQGTVAEAIVDLDLTENGRYIT